LTYLFLNFHAKVRQQAFQIKGVKCIGRNASLAVLCQIAGFLVVQSSDEQGLTV